MSIRKASATLLHRDGRVLCVERGPDQSFFPGHHAFAGGTLEADDQADDEEATFRRCAVREVAEETDVDLDADDLVPAGRVLTPPFSPLRYDTRMFFAELPDDADPAPGGDAADVHWHDPGDAVDRWTRFDLDLPPPVRAYLEAFADRGPDAARDLEKDDRDVRERIAITLHPGHRLVPLATQTLPPWDHTNAYLVGGERFVVVDPGSPRGDEQAALARIVRDRLDAGDRLLGIVATHPHPDHVGGLADLCHRFGAPAWCHPRAADDLDVVPRRPLDDGEAIDLGTYGPTGEDWTLTVHHLPGHHPGHIALEDSRRGAWIVGDLIVRIGTVMISPPDGDMATYLDSLRRMRAADPSVLFPAHGPPIPDPEAAIDDLIDHRLAREDRILDAVRDGRSRVGSIVDAAYDDLDAGIHGLAERQATAHLLKLEDDGEVVRDGEGWHPAEEE